MGVARRRTHAQATDQQEENCVAYVETGTNSQLIVAILPKVLQSSLKSKQSR